MAFDNEIEFVKNGSRLSFVNLTYTQIQPNVILVLVLIHKLTFSCLILASSEGSYGNEFWGFYNVTFYKTYIQNLTDAR